MPWVLALMKSAATLAMAAPGKVSVASNGSDDIACRVYHGPAYRLVVDLADTSQAQFVIAGGNGGRADSPMASNHYAAWLAGYFTLKLKREEVTP